MILSSLGRLCIFDWELSCEIHGCYQDGPRETFFHQKPYSPQVLESLPTTMGPGNKDKTCQPVPMAADAGLTSSQLSKNMEKCIWKTMMVHFIFLLDSELSRT